MNAPGRLGATRLNAHPIGCGLVAALALLASPATLAQGAIKPVEALVVNPANRPVQVQVLSAPAPEGEGSRENYVVATAFEFVGSFGCVEQTVPAGKRLVLQHIGGQTGLLAPAALVSMVTRLGTGFSDLIVPAAPPVANASGANHSAAGQQVNAYYDQNFQVCAHLSSLVSLARISFYLRGYLVNKP